MTIIKCHFSCVFILIAYQINKITVNAVYPYPVAGATHKLLPQPKPYTQPDIIPSVSPLDDIINKAMDDAVTQPPEVEEIPNTYTGSSAQAYINGGIDGAIAAANLSTKERYGREIQYAISILSLLTFVPFFWFIFSGNSIQLHYYYMGGITSYGAFTYILTWLINSYEMGSGYIPISVACIIGAGCFYLGFYYSRIAWYFTLFWCIYTMLFFVRCLPGVGPLVYIGFIPIISAASGLYIFVTIIAILISFAVLKYRNNENRTKINSMITAIDSSFGFLNALGCILENMGLMNGYDLVKLYSVPAMLTLSNITNIVLTIFLSALIGISIFINHLRYKQFGILKDEEAANSLLVKNV